MFAIQIQTWFKLQALRVNVKNSIFSNVWMLLIYCWSIVKQEKVIDVYYYLWFKYENKYCMMKSPTKWLTPQTKQIFTKDYLFCQISILLENLSNRVKTTDLNFFVKCG